MFKQALYEFDREARLECGAEVLAGIDEAGRGPLAGPVVVAGVVFPAGMEAFPAVDDSKALTAEKRDKLAEEIRAIPGIRVAIAVRSAGDIDRMNILQATHSGMREVAQELNPGLALVDGLKVPRFPVPVRFIVKGDGTSASIAAASIIAKTYRDALMIELDKKYPAYGFAKHKGYGTAEHLEALRKYGACPVHRMTFAPVKNILEPPPVQMEFQL